MRVSSSAAEAIFFTARCTHCETAPLQPSAFSSPSLPRRSSPGFSWRWIPGFRVTCTTRLLPQTHYNIVAISGFNIAIIAGALSKLARRVFSVSTATFVVIGGLVIYTLLVGANASVVRAAIMGSLSLLALYYHRQNDALYALAIAALAMCAINPYTLYDLGFQLSFLATLGLVLFSEPMTQWFERFIEHILRLARAALHAAPGNVKEDASPDASRAKQIVTLFSDSFIVTLAAQITTTPLILFTFHRLSTISLLTNFLILPAQPPLMILGGIATIGGMILQPLG